jgi:anti-sigma factor RsiW
MTCKTLITSFLDDYLAGALPPARRLEFQLHLALCRPCRKYLASYRQTVHLARSTRTPPAPPAPPQ